ncbi:MAG: hypothetical protein C4325_06990 [Blastocatellia bacterium]
MGYSISAASRQPVIDEVTTIGFHNNPPNSLIRLVYDRGSRSGAVGTTIFRYIVTNFAVGDNLKESFLDLSSLLPGKYLITVFAAERNQNRTSRDISIETTD